MKGDFHVRFCEKFEVGFLLLTRLRGRGLVTPSYSINEDKQRMKTGVYIIKDKFFEDMSALSGRFAAAL